MARAVLAETAHHVTQRGIDRQPIFFSDADRHIYLEMVQISALRYEARLLGYCLMSNHVHWVAIPERPDSLSRAFGRAHARYAQYINARRNRTGHFWQNRFFSCALDGAHLWAALRYVERNPLRAGLAAAAEDWPWSSAAGRTGKSPWPDWLDPAPWSNRFTPQDWQIFLDSSDLAEADLRLRVNTKTGRPAGSPAFLAIAETALQRSLEPKKGGRPRKKLDAVTDPDQTILLAR